MPISGLHLLATHSFHGAQFYAKHQTKLPHFSTFVMFISALLPQLDSIRAAAIYPRDVHVVPIVLRLPPICVDYAVCLAQHGMHFVRVCWSIQGVGTPAR